LSCAAGLAPLAMGKKEEGNRLSTSAVWNADSGGRNFTQDKQGKKGGGGESTARRLGNESHSVQELPDEKKRRDVVSQLSGSRRESDVVTSYASDTVDFRRGRGKKKKEGKSHRFW